MRNMIIVKKSKIEGSGVFAKKDIKKGKRIIEYVGKKITKEKADEKYELEAKKAERKGQRVKTYFFSLNKRYDLDGNVKHNPAKYINHSCEPNCETLNEDGRIWIIAIKNIKRGKELTYDYGYPLENFEEHPCYCGSKSCFGHIVKKSKRKRLKTLLRKKKSGTKKSYSRSVRRS